MFDSKIYTKRRNELKKKMGSGLILFPGNEEPAMNYPANTYTFRQDSSFLFYFGLDMPDVFGLIDVDNNEEIIFGNDFTVDDVVWMGPQKTIKQKAEFAGVKKTLSLDKLEEKLLTAIKTGRRIHFLPQYRWKIVFDLSKLLGINPESINKYSSEKLIKNVIDQRSIKSKEEIAETEFALEIAYQMHTYAMRMTRPGICEREIAGAIEGIALSMGCGVSFSVIFSINGQTLHNHHHDNLIKDGDLVVNDSGAESLLHYASDITRTFPANGKFSNKQKEIYQIALNAQMGAIQKIKPGIKYKDVHLHSAKVIVEGLKNLGLMKGNVDEAVAAGAHALFFPHGLGHMLGLDVHDLEGLGENFVGYDKSIERSNQFGLAYLRLAKPLQQGFLLTVEPGVYFIPELIDQWRSNKMHSQFINYDAVAKYRTFGGVRIEDNILVEKNAGKVLGRPIPKSVEEVEQFCSSII